MTADENEMTEEQLARFLRSAYLFNAAIRSVPAEESVCVTMPRRAFKTSCLERLERSLQKDGILVKRINHRSTDTDFENFAVILVDEICYLSADMLLALAAHINGGGKIIAVGTLK